MLSECQYFHLILLQSDDEVPRALPFGYTEVIFFPFILELRYKVFCCLSSLSVIDRNKCKAYCHDQAHDDERDDNGRHVIRIYMTNSGMTMPVAKEETQDRQCLILGQRIKVLKVGKVIELNTERKKLCK